MFRVLITHASFFHGIARDIGRKIMFSLFSFLRKKERRKKKKINILREVKLKLFMAERKPNPSVRFIQGEFTTPRLRYGKETRDHPGSLTVDTTRQAINSARDTFVVQSSTMTGVQGALNIPDASGHKTRGICTRPFITGQSCRRLLSRYFTVKRCPAGKRVQKFT